MIIFALRNSAFDAGRIPTGYLLSALFLAIAYLTGGFFTPPSSSTKQMLAAELLNSICKPSQILDANSSAGRAAPVVEPVSSENISDIPGKKITVVRLTFPPGGLSLEHHHGGSVTVYVLSGAIRSQLAGLPPATYKAGETFFEPIGTVHLFAENLSTTEPAEVLATFIHDEGATLTTYH
jgi:quercetin dioxygenase-like cupin family protein